MPDRTEIIVEAPFGISSEWIDTDLNHSTGLVKQICLAHVNVGWIILEESGSNFTIVFNIWRPHEYYDPTTRIHCISKLSLLRDALVHKYPVKIRHDPTGSTILDLAIATEDFSLR